MTAHEKRTFTQLNEGSDPFDECVQIYSVLLRGAPIEEVARIVRYEWRMARKLGIPESDICDFLRARTRRHFRQRWYRPKPSTFTLNS